VTIVFWVEQFRKIAFLKVPNVVRQMPDLFRLGKKQAFNTSFLGEEVSCYCKSMVYVLA